MIVNLSEYRKKVSNATQSIAEENKNQMCEPHDGVAILDRSLDTPAVQRAVQRARERAW